MTKSIYKDVTITNKSTDSILDFSFEGKELTEWKAQACISIDESELLSEISTNDLLSQVDINDAVDYYGKYEILEEFSASDIVNCFDNEDLISELTDDAMLSFIDCDDAVEYYGADSVLDEISASSVVDYKEASELLEHISSDEIVEHIANKFSFDDVISLLKAAHINEINKSNYDAVIKYQSEQTEKESNDQAIGSH